MDTTLRRSRNCLAVILRQLRDRRNVVSIFVAQLPSCHTQARSLDEVNQRIREAIELCLEVEGAPERSLEFIGIQRITIAA